LRWSQGPSQVQGGQSGRRGALRLRWACRLRESLALFPRVIVRGLGGCNSQGTRFALDKKVRKRRHPTGGETRGGGRAPHQRWHKREASKVARGHHARTASGAHARPRTLRPVPQITVCGCGLQPACRPGRRMLRGKASKRGSARGLRQDPIFVAESGGREPACPLGLTALGSALHLVAESTTSPVLAQITRKRSLKTGSCSRAGSVLSYPVQKTRCGVLATRLRCE